MQNYRGVIGTIVLVLDVWAIISVLSSGISISRKVLWIVLILLLPILGFVLWLLIGPSTPKA